MRKQSRQLRSGTNIQTNEIANKHFKRLHGTGRRCVERQRSEEIVVFVRDSNFNVTNNDIHSMFNGSVKNAFIRIVVLFRINNVNMHMYRYYNSKPQNILLFLISLLSGIASTTTRMN